MDENKMNNTNLQNTYRATSNLNVDIENPQIRMNSAVGMNITNNNVDSQNYGTTSNNSFYNNSYSPSSFEQNSSVNDNNFNSLPYQNNDSILNSQSNQFITNSVNNLEKRENRGSQEGQFINSSLLNSSNILPAEDYHSNNQYTTAQYEPTMEENKKKEPFQIPSEVKVTGFIVFILLIFILLMPYVYDFIKNIQLALTR